MSKELNHVMMDDRFSMDKYVQAIGNPNSWDRALSNRHSDYYKLTQAIERSDWTDFISESVLPGLYEIEELELIAERLFTRINTDRPVISFLEEYGFDAEVLQEGQAPKYATLRHSKKTFRAGEFGRGLKFSKHVLRDTDMLPLLGRSLSRMGRAIAFRENQYLLATAVTGVADGTNIHKTGDIYASHLFDANFDGAVNSGAMDVQKIQITQQVFADEGYDLNTMIVNPASYTPMLGLQDFRSSNVIRFLSPEAQKTADGSMERPHFMPNGMEIITNRALPPGMALFIDKDEFGLYSPIEELNMVELPIDLAREIRMGFYKASIAAVDRPQAGAIWYNLDSTKPEDSNI